MPIGDIGGFASMLIMTCIADSDINKDDPVTFVGDYKVRSLRGPVFGQAKESAKKGETLPILTRGIARFKIDPTVSKKIDKWLINSAGQLRPRMDGEKLNVLYRVGERLDVLL